MFFVRITFHFNKEKGTLKCFVLTVISETLLCRDPSVWAAGMLSFKPVVLHSPVWCLCHPDTTPCPVLLLFQLPHSCWLPSQAAPMAPATPQPLTSSWDEPTASEHPPRVASPSPRPTAHPTERYVTSSPRTPRPCAVMLMPLPILPSYSFAGMFNLFQVLIPLPTTLGYCAICGVPLSPSLPSPWLRRRAEAFASRIPQAFLSLDFLVIN